MDNYYFSGVISNGGVVLIRNRHTNLLNLLKLLGLLAAGIALNVAGSKLNGALGLPLYLDNLGTILIAAIGGYLPAVSVGFFSNIISGITDDINTYYCFITVMIAFAAAFFARKGWLMRFPHILAAILTFSVIGGGIGSLLTWFLYGFGWGWGISVDLGQTIADALGWDLFAADMVANFLLDLFDKTVVTLLAVAIYKLLPKKLLGWFAVYIREVSFKNLLSEEGRRSLSVRVKVVLIVTISTALVAASGAAVSMKQYHDSTINEYKLQGQSITNMMAERLDSESLRDYVENGAAAKGYERLEDTLYSIKSSVPEVSYIYIYQIREDGARVVLDLDTEALEADEFGDILPLDDYMTQNLGAFLSGEEVEPVITNDEYGWLLTVYHPVGSGDALCYACADLSMATLLADEVSFLARIISIFLGFLTLIMVFTLWIADRMITEPISSIAHAASGFAYDTAEARRDSLENIKALNIRTGDEMEYLYRAICKTTEDMVGYIEDVQAKNEQITKMQDGLIVVLADLVESRDQCTGDHIRKTAAYVKIIMEQMKKDGIYADVLTDEYMEDVIRSAPLHDIGKIHVPDALLNKPGRLTDEEFKLMQNHALAGSQIITQAISNITEETGYLSEAKNLAEFHHEKWNGKGYPHGLSGEEIPLSARIMAVADVFDALVSRRIYKPPFPIEKAIDIIRSEAGQHFDEKIVEAFLHAEDDVRRVAEENADE